METAKIFLNDLLNKSVSKNNLFKRNILKEYLQIFVLDFIYSHKEYSKMVFYGGSCLAHCFGLPRLSEDLDFVDLKKKIKIPKLAENIEKHFKENTDLGLKATVQKFRIYLKFPILKELGLSRENETDLLFLKIEIFNSFDFCKKYKTQMVPLFKFNKSILVRTFDLPTLMATKISAILYRKWEKTGKNGKVLVKVKGRDYFDLMWYLDKGIRPDIKCVGGIKNEKDLKAKMLKIIDNVDVRSIRLDLESLIEDEKFINNLSKNLKNILREKLK
jgi:predicted nucleotidyltransferase component of viral defense system